MNTRTLSVALLALALVPAFLACPDKTNLRAASYRTQASGIAIQTVVEYPTPTRARACTKIRIRLLNRQLLTGGEIWGERSIVDAASAHKRWREGLAVRRDGVHGSTVIHRGRHL